jgi:hypothetical protein
MSAYADLEDEKKIYIQMNSRLCNYKTHVDTNRNNEIKLCNTPNVEIDQSY